MTRTRRAAFAVVIAWAAGCTSIGGDELVSAEAGGDEPAEGAYFQPRLEAGQVSEFTGSASYSFDLEMPAGTGGLTIPLSLHYSSSIVNNKWGDHKADGSWLGAGWKLDIGRIEVAGDDTTLTLNGKSEELISRDPYPGVTGISCPSSSGAWMCKNARTDHLRARVNGFDKVLKHAVTWERVDYNPHRVSEVRNDAVYEVWDQSGTRYEFGRRRFQGLPAGGWWDWDWQRDVKDYSRTYMVARDAWVSWAEFRSFGLDRVEDVHGNSIDIDYVSYADDAWLDVGGEGLPHFSRKEIYPSVIRYTRNLGAGDSHEEYEVEFITSRKQFSDGDTDTVDAQVAQSGVVLHRIKMWFLPHGGGAPVLIREYVFDYAIDSDPDARGSRSYRLTKIDQYGRGGQAGGARLPSTTFAYQKKTLRWNNLDHLRWYLTGIDNGRGASRSFTYQSFDSSRTQQHVVGQATTESGTGPVMQTSYAYFEPARLTNQLKSDTQTLNGFGKVHRIDGDLRVESRFFAYDTLIDPEGDDNNDDFPLQGRSRSVLSESYPDGRDLKKTENTWQVDDLAEGGKHVYVSQTVDSVWGDDGTLHRSKKVFRYHLADQNCQTPSGCSWDGAVQRGRLTRTFEYPDAGSPWYRLKLEQFSANEAAWLVMPVTSKILDSDWVPVSESHTIVCAGATKGPRCVPNARGLVLATRRRVSMAGDQWIDQRRAYDAFGNPTSTTSYSGYGSGSALATAGAATTITTFDPDYHQFPIASQNPLGHITQTRYYGVNQASGAGSGLPGQVMETRDANGVWGDATRYDAFGRATHTWRRGIAAADRWDVARASSVKAYDDAANSLMVSVRDDDGSQPSYQHSWTFFDGVGRVLQKQAETVGGVAVVNTYYDDRGRVAGTTSPHGNAMTGAFLAADYANTSHARSHSDYDPLGRPMRTYAYDGSYVEMAYDEGQRGTATTSARGTQVVKRVADGLGRVVQVREIERTSAGNQLYAATDYEYDEASNLLAIIDDHGNRIEYSYDAVGRKLSEDDPDRGLTTLSYDARGQVVSETDARGTSICTSYDQLGRTTYRRTVASTSCSGSGGGKLSGGLTLGAPTPATGISWSYDLGAYGIGRLYRVGNQEASTEFQYDAAGRPVSSVRTVAGHPGEMITSTVRDELGRAIEVAMPDGETLVSTFDAAGRQTSLVGERTYVASASYDDRGDLSSVVLGNGLVQRFNYHGASGNFRLSAIRTESGGKNALTLQHLVYSYDDDGNVTSIYDYQPPGTCEPGSGLLSKEGSACLQRQQFEYDFMGRLTRAHTTGSVGVVADYDMGYSYDTLGNIIATADHLSGETTEYNYSYGGTAGGPHAVSASRLAGSPLWMQKWKYDAMGNMVERRHGGTWALGWDDYGRLSSMGVSGQAPVRFAYDHSGSLVRKEHSDGSQSFYFGDIEIVEGQIFHYYRFGQRRVAMRRGQEEPVFLLGDHLRSVQLATDDVGQVISRTLVEPFGRRRFAAGTSPTDFEFAGERRHGDLDGVYHMGARFYDPEIGRWLSADSILPDSGNPQKLNRYSYVTNSPLRYRDPTGHDGCETNAAECPEYILNFHRQRLEERFGVEFSGDWTLEELLAVELGLRDLWDALGENTFAMRLGGAALVRERVDDPQAAAYAHRFSRGATFYNGAFGDSDWTRWATIHEMGHLVQGGNNFTRAFLGTVYNFAARHYSGDGAATQYGSESLYDGFVGFLAEAMGVKGVEDMAEAFTAIVYQGDPVWWEQEMSQDRRDYVEGWIQRMQLVDESKASGAYYQSMAMH